MIFLTGGFSHVDTFDYKPALNRYHGKPVPSFGLRQRRDARPPALGSPFRFRPCGESGLMISELFPNLGTMADELCVIRSAAHRHRRAFPGGAGDAHRLGDRADAGPRCLAQLWPGHVQPAPCRLTWCSASTCRTPAPRSGTAASCRRSTRACASCRARSRSPTCVRRARPVTLAGARADHAARRQRAPRRRCARTIADLRARIAVVRRRPRA